MSKINLTDLSTITGNETSAINTINNNSTLIETFSDNTLSRDGTTPNTMLADLDMNSHRVLNCVDAVNDQEPATYGQTIALINTLTGGGAPNNVSYLTLGTSSLLTAERVLTAGTGISFTDGGSGSTLTVNATGGTGDVVGPASATDTAIVKFNGTTGKLVQNSALLIDSSNNIKPAANDGGALGTTTLKWSDLFLANGGVINFNSGDVTITHSTDTLTFAGSNNGYIFDAGLQTAGTMLMLSGTAVPAGGTAGQGYKFSSVTNLGMFFGSGAPTLSAAKGSIYLRTDGSDANTRLYSNSNGSTTWVNLVASA